MTAKKRRHGEQRFYALLEEMAALHEKKSRDYGGTVDPLANLRASADFGVSPFLATIVRLHDKIARLKTFCRTGKLANEGVEDSLRDIGVYSQLALILFREACDAKAPARRKP